MLLSVKYARLITIPAMADDVKSFKIGDRVAADNSELCGHW